MRDDGRSSIDEAIDETARTLTAGAPRSSLREGVRRRIAVRRQPLFALLWRPALVGAALTAVIVALLWPNRAPVGEVSTSNEEAASAAGATISGSAPDAGRGVDPDSAETTPTLADVRRSEVTGDSPTPPGAGTAMRTEPASPLVVEALDVPPLVIDPLQLEMLVVEGLRLEPLSLQ